MNACPELLDLPGVGVITAAQFLICWSHPGRIRNEAAFAALAGVAPIPASSGTTIRHRLNRSGDRQLNPSPAHRRPLTASAPRAEPGIRSPAHRRRQVQPRHQTLPKTRHRARNLPPTRGACSHAQPAANRRLTRHRSILANGLGIRACQAGHAASCSTDEAPAPRVLWLSLNVIETFLVE
jgi:Transposase IS116/IS110/IS902 family